MDTPLPPLALWRRAGRLNDRTACPAQQVACLVEAADHRRFAGGFYKAASGLDFRAHRPRWEHLSARLLAWSVRSGVPSWYRREPRIGDIGEDQQGVGAEVAGEQRCGQVRVDDRLRARQQPTLPAGNRDSPTAGADDDGTRRDQRLGRCELLSELVEASTRSGHNALATQAHASLRDRARASGTDLAFGTESRASALVSEGEGADVHCRQSIEYFGRTNIVVHMARSHLVYGEWLRREGRRVDARSQLRSAQIIFDELGSKAFAEGTHRELLATGETVHKRTFSAYSGLTPQEDQIARLAGSRLTNSEIGTRLFISPRTVEWHLRKVFTKLGVTSRRELRFSYNPRSAAGSRRRRHHLVMTSADGSQPEIQGRPDGLLTV